MTKIITKHISFGVNRQQLAGTLFFPNKSPKNPALLFIHGWESNRGRYFERATQLSKVGFIVLTFDLRGHGDSPGKIKRLPISKHLDDVLAAYDLLVSQKSVAPTKIGVIGASYGGYLASILTAKRPVKWLVLRAPAIYKDSHFQFPKAQLNEQEVKKYRLAKIHPKTNLALKSLTQFKADVLIVESEHDTSVPHQTIQNYLQSLKSAKSITHTIIKNADHSLTQPSWQKHFIKTLTSWILSKTKHSLRTNRASISIQASHSSK